jgi:hypothetical protein
MVANQSDGCRFTIELRRPTSAVGDAVDRDGEGEDPDPRSAV